MRSILLHLPSILFIVSQPDHVTSFLHPTASSQDYSRQGSLLAKNGISGFGSQQLRDNNLSILNGRKYNALSLNIPRHGRNNKITLGVTSLDNERVEEVANTANTATDEDNNEDQNYQQKEEGRMKKISAFINDKIGTVEESRLAFPEIVSGEVPRMFSNISYEKKEQTNGQFSELAAIHRSGSTLGAAALVAGTTIGAGVLALPTATAPAGFLPSSFALFIAWMYMTISGLLIAELSINRMGETGKQGVGLLEIYKSYLGDGLGRVGSAAYFFLHYAIMCAYVSAGGDNLGSFLDTIGLGSITSVHGLDQILFALGAGGFVYFANPKVVERFNNILVLGVIGSFLGVVGLGAGSADFNALISLENQHPDQVVDAFPILFLSLVFHNVVPTIVTQLEADRKKITTAIVAGSFIPFLMFSAWNGVILGNIISTPGALDSDLSPIALLQNEGVGGQTLGNLVGIFSELAVITSLIGFIYGLLDGLTDLTNLPTKGPKFEKWKPALFAGVLAPPLLFSLGNPDIFYDALDYGGAFGVSTLFLVLPPLMVWKVRYSDKDRELSVPPMVPLGKIPLGSLWKAAGTLILEQGAAKLGVFEFIQKTFLE